MIVGARLPLGKAGIACVFWVGPWRASIKHNTAVPFFVAIPPSVVLVLFL